jgi:fanconi-associated nuclease 1
VTRQCIGPSNLSQICKIFSEEYGHRTGGMPDLCLWKYTEREKRCLFSEVKGPGDRLSETQENWIDFLAGLGGTLEVELCHLREVKEDGTPVTPRKNSQTSQKEVKLAKKGRTA